MQWFYELDDKERTAVLAYALCTLQGTLQDANQATEVREFAEKLLMSLKEESREIKKELPQRKLKNTFEDAGIGPGTLETLNSNNDLGTSVRKKNIVQTPKVLSNTQKVLKKEKKKEFSLFGWTIRSGNDL